MNLQTVLNSKQAGRLALFLSRCIPPSVGYRLARIIAARIAANPQTPMVQAIRANQWVVSGGNLSASELDEAVLESLVYITRAFFEFFHYLDNPAKLDELVVFDTKTQELVRRSFHAERGVVACGLHVSGADLVFRAIARKGIRASLLSLPEMSEAVEWQHNIRRQVGVEILPTTVANIRQSIHRLEAGEAVFTGVDHPMPDLKNHPVFFKRPAQLPTHHIFLALKARVPIVLISAGLENDGRYHIYSSDDIEMEPCADRGTEIIYNAERVLQIAEALIRISPRQWSVFQPVWPQVLDEVP